MSTLPRRAAQRAAGILGDAAEPRHYKMPILLWYKL